MKKIIKVIFDSYLKRRNQIRISSESKQNIINLIRKLHPIDTGCNLIRLGPNKDGGYLVPDDLIGISACFSPGVYEISDFEFDCFKRGMKLFLADSSIEAPTIDIPNDRYEFVSKFIGATDNESFMTLDTWVKNTLTDQASDLLLQMDIEGWEYFAIINASDALLRRFRIIVVEFHNLNQLWIPSFYNLAHATFNKLLQTHTCVHIHPNNDSKLDIYNGVEIPPLAEFTFYRNDRIDSKCYEHRFPNPLDFKNVELNPDVILPSQWFSVE